MSDTRVSADELSAVVESIRSQARRMTIEAIERYEQAMADYRATDAEIGALTDRIGHKAGDHGPRLDAVRLAERLDSLNFIRRSRAEGVLLSAILAWQPEIGAGANLIKAEKRDWHNQGVAFGGKVYLAMQNALSPDEVSVGAEGHDGIDQMRLQILEESRLVRLD